MAAHIVPKRVYYTVFFSLEILTVVTAVVAKVDLGRANTFVAMFIAVAKTLIVALFFMHVKYSTRLTQLTVALGVFWLGILLSLTMTDYISRIWESLPKF